MNLNIQTCEVAPNSDYRPTQAREGASNQPEGVTSVQVENTSVFAHIRKDTGVVMGELKRKLAMPTSLAVKPSNGVFAGVDVVNGVLDNQSVIHHACSCCGKTLGKMQNNSGKAETLGKMQNNSGKAETLGKMQNSSVFAIPQNYAETNPTWQFVKNIQANEKTVPCRDKTIVAVLTHEPTGQKFYGTNGIKRDVGHCPRNESNHRMKDGYDKCRNICHQEHHAEIAALLSAVRHAPNLPLNQCVIDVYGTLRVCDNCQMVLNKHGVYINGVYPNLEEMKSWTNI